MSLERADKEKLYKNQLVLDMQGRYEQDKDGLSMRRDKVQSAVRVMKTTDFLQRPPEDP